MIISWVFNGAPTIFLAYVGPGAGFAFLGSFLILFVAFFLALFSVLTFPLRFTVGAVLRRTKRVKSSVKRIVVIGLDGLDPRHVRRLMDKQELPHFSALAEQGVFSELKTTCPPISPVAWSSFATGVNPGKHNIFDFLNRDLRTCMPELSSSRVRFIKEKGIFRRQKAETVLLRKSRPFWCILGDYGIFSTVLRVPVTFPPEKFRGLSLSAMCTPDLRGTQGTFTLYESSSNGKKTMTGGMRVPVTMNGRRIRTHLSGPLIESRTLQIPLVIDLGKNGKTAVLHVSRQKIKLSKGVYSEWIKVTFRAGMTRITGICRFLLVSTSPEFKLYVTPLNIDPERPAMPVSHPLYYAIYLAKLHGAYATLGLAEDTWALEEGAIDEGAFLQQVYDIQKEREDMFLDALKRTRKGLCCCVFDASDRIQHTFLRYLDDDYMAARKTGEAEHSKAVDDVYRRMDALLGRTMDMIDNDTVLFVISDHGFSSFRRGINLNTWLIREGFLVLKGEPSDNEYLADVDWTKTKAYSFGLSGIYLNVKGREANGIISDNGEKKTVKAEIMRKLTALKDPEGGQVAIHAVYDSEIIYSGPYKDNGPDIIVGYENGYRVSWETAVGRTDGDLFVDNTKCWQGDHCIDQSLVPGVFFCNRKVNPEQGKPHITDMAPTILGLLGVDKPGYMDGRILAIELEKKR